MLASISRTHRLNAAGELKAARILRSAQGRELAQSLIDSLLELGSRPVFSLYEKRWIGSRHHFGNFVR
jgi:hypothetical protein